MRPWARQAGTNIALQITTHNHGVKHSSLLLRKALCVRVRISLTVRHAACSSFVAPCSVCTSTGTQWRAAQSGWRWGPSAGPRRTATAPRTSDLDVKERTRCMSRRRRNTTAPPCATCLPHGGTRPRFLTHFLAWGRFYGQRNTSTRLPHGPVRRRLATSCASTCKKKQSGVSLRHLHSWTPYLSFLNNPSSHL